MANYIYENIKVIRVIDADTLEMEIDLGFWTWHLDTFRLARINAWETRGKERKKGLIAKEWLIELLKKAEVEEKPVKIQTIKKGKYGRILCEVWVGDLNVNDALVAEGHAKYQKY